MGLTLFLVFSVEKVSTQRRKIRDKNRFVDKLINDEPVDGSLAVHKYRNLISEELDPEDTLKVSTVIGDLEVKVKDLP